MNNAEIRAIALEIAREAVEDVGGDFLGLFERLDTEDDGLVNDVSQELANIRDSLK